MKIVLALASVLGVATVVRIPLVQATHHPAHALGAGVCSVDSLGKAMAVDTAKLKRRTSELPVGEATEGGEVTVYTENGRARVVVILSAGEMGRSIVRYFLVTPREYVVQYEQLRYEMPLRFNPSAKLVSRLTSTRYVCDTSELQVPDPDERARIDSELTATLSRLGLGS
jgi:hypothetical protein